MKLTFDNSTLELIPNGKGYIVTLDDKLFFVEVIRASNGQVELLIDNQRVTACVSSDKAKRWVTVNGQTIVLTKSSGAKRRGEQHDRIGALMAPMPGQVRAVNVREGDVVTKGQTLLVLEAMKMEIRIQAPRDGAVKALFVEHGQTVEREQILIEIE